MKKQQGKRDRGKSKARKAPSLSTSAKGPRRLRRVASNDADETLRIPISPAAALSKERQTAEKRLALILEATTEGYWDWDLQSGEFYYGPGWLSSLGYCAKDLPKDISFWESIIHPDYYAKFERELQQHLSGERPSFDCECQLRAKSGHYKWFRQRGKVIDRSEDGRALRIVGTIVDIEDRRRAIDQLAKSQAQLSAVIQGTNDPIFSVDTQAFGLITYNSAFQEYAARFLGRKLREGMTPEEFLPPDRAKNFARLLQRVLAEGNFSTDYKIEASGNTLHLSFHQLVRNQHVFGISVFGRDITERKRTEEALRKSEEKFAKAFLESPMALALTSMVDHRYIEVNETFEQLSGYDREQIIGKTPFDIGILVNPAQRYDFTEKLSSEGRIRNMEIQYRTRAGEVRDALGSAELIELDGEPCMLAVIADVTDRKRVEEALRDSEERLHLAIEAGNMYAFQWDPQTDRVVRSKESSEILGGSAASTQYSGEEFMQRVHPEDRDHRRGIVASLTPEHPTFKTTYRLIRPNSTVVWLEDSGRAIFDTKGNITRIVGMTADVTTAKQTEKILRELSGRLITSQEEERRRVGRELHDSIGQHLALLAIRAQRIDSGESEAEGTVRADIHELHRKIKEIATKVSDLSHQLHSSELEFLGLAIATERLCRDFSRQYGIEIDHQVKAVPRLDNKVALCFYRIIQESLRNAGKHSRADRVTLVLTGNDDRLTLTVEDNGRGFDLEEAQNGAGLGLLSMQERMNLVGGTLTIRSAPGKGTALTARLLLLHPK